MVCKVGAISSLASDMTSFMVRRSSIRISTPPEGSLVIAYGLLPSVRSSVFIGCKWVKKLITWRVWFTHPLSHLHKIFYSLSLLLLYSEGFCGENGKFSSSF